jgi:hypothetical protein
MMWRAVVIVLAIACCCLCGSIAEFRGRSIKAWAWLGAIFGPAGLLLVATSPLTAHKRPTELQTEALPACPLTIPPGSPPQLVV